MCGEMQEVNDRYCRERAFGLTLTVDVNNAGTPQEFESASISDEQIRELWGREVEGTTCPTISSAAKMAEMLCTSHESLSPIRVKQSK